MCRGIEYVHIVVQTPAFRTFSFSRTESPHSLNTNSPAPCPGSHCSYLFSVSECNCSRPLPNWVPSHPSRAPSRPPPHLGTCPQYPAALRVPVLVLLPSPLPELPAPHSGPHLASCLGENAEANELLLPYAIQVLLWPWPFPWPGAAPPLRLPVLLLKKQESAGIRVGMGLAGSSPVRTFSSCELLDEHLPQCQCHNYLGNATSYRIACTFIDKDPT